MQGQGGVARAEWLSWIIEYSGDDNQLCTSSIIKRSVGTSILLFFAVVIKASLLIRVILSTQPYHYSITLISPKVVGAM